MISTLSLPRALLAQLKLETLNAIPRECCGLIEGKVDWVTATACALHPMQNMATGLSAFEIDPAAHIALRRRLRAQSRRIIGCYHSHPNGVRIPSVRDLDEAGEEDFVWLIAACRGRDIDAGAFIFKGGAFSSLRLNAEQEDAGRGAVDRQRGRRYNARPLAPIV